MAAKIFASAAIAALLLSPSTAAGPGSPSYEQGKQSIDDAARQGPLHVTDLAGYCDTLLGWDLKSGRIGKVESRSDFIAGCADQGSNLLASQ